MLHCRIIIHSSKGSSEMPHLPTPHESTREDALILTIILEDKIQDHHELLEKLKNHNVHLTQSTLSRRLNKLGVAKIQGFYQKAQTAVSALPPLLSIEMAAPNLIVLHTFPGHAGAVGIHLDQIRINYQASQTSLSNDLKNPLSGFLGTIAGDDTILVIVKNQTYLDPLKVFISKEFSKS